VFNVAADASQLTLIKPLPAAALPELVHALIDVFRRAELNASHHIQMEALSVREKMSHILATIADAEQDHSLFTGLFILTEGRLGVVVTFLAVLELLKQSLIEFVQAAPFAPIYLKRV
jgi:segregation and condensation protein A